MSEYPIWQPGFSGTAQDIARMAHSGQVDKSGAPYIKHPAAVAARVMQLAWDRGWRTYEPRFKTAAEVAWLHDVVEDTSVSRAILLDLHCPEDTFRRVVLLTRPYLAPNWSREIREAQTARYYERIKADEIALLVKEADIEHNTHPERMAALSTSTQKRLKTKYDKAIKALGLDLRTERPPFLLEETI